MSTAAAGSPTPRPLPTPAFKLPATFAALSVRNFRVYAAGQAMANTGQWMTSVAQDWVQAWLPSVRGRA